ncbi:hypothetical protein ACJX0J_006006, partial [Zea mays]
SKGNAHGETSLDVLNFSPNHQHIPCGKEETFNPITSKLSFIVDFNHHIIIFVNNIKRHDIIMQINAHVAARRVKGEGFA